jgi:hypothetical protein
VLGLKTVAAAVSPGDFGLMKGSLLAGPCWRFPTLLSSVRRLVRFSSALPLCFVVADLRCCVGLPAPDLVFMDVWFACVLCCPVN